MKKMLFASILGLAICYSFVIPNEVRRPPVATNFLTDYRDGYVGYYFCKRWATTFKVEGAPNEVKDTITIHIEKDAADSVLLFTIGAVQQKFKLVGGNLYPYPDGSVPFRNGGFTSTTKVHFIIRYGRASSTNYIGVKN